MGKRINYKGYVGESYKNFKVIEYEKLDKKHMFLIKFHHSKNEQWVTWNRLKNYSTIQDQKLLKERNKLKRIAFLKKRNQNITKHKEPWKKPRISKGDVLVLDLATISTGATYVKNGIVKATTTLIVDDSYRFDVRVKKMADEIRHLVVSCEIDTIVFEGIYLGLNSSILEKLAIMRGIIIGNNLECKTHIVPIQNWKKYWGIISGNDRGKAKSQAIAAGQGFICSTDDESDSLLIALYLLDAKRTENIVLEEW